MNENENEKESVKTPDGQELSHAMCTCSVHCANNCEPGHCNTGWCRCFCHEKKYQEMAKKQS